MGSPFTLDYNCPQFVDFSVGLDNSGKGDIFFDCQDRLTSTSSDVFRNMQTPVGVAKKKKLNSNFEKQLMNKMTNALKFIEKTPGVATTSKKGQQAQNTAFKNTRWQFTGPSLASNASSKMRRSKSVVNINKAAQKIVNGLRKRSSSLSDLRHIKKCPTKSASTYPMTPMCLKRTIVNSKNKILKSSEEIELEEIARLQKELYQRLRYNEMSLKRLNLKPRTTGAIQKTNPKTENIKDVCKKGLLSVSEKPDVVAKDSKPDVKSVNPEASSANAHSAFSKPASRALENKIKENIQLAKTRKTIAETETNDKCETKQTRKTINKVGFHSGIMFHEPAKKSTVTKPFNFSIKPNQVNSQSTAVDAIKCTKAVSNLKNEEGKENIPLVRSKSFAQNQKAKTILDLTPIGKVLERRAVTRSRGLTFSNVARN